MTKIQLTYCGMAGEGPTVKEAKQDAARKIEAVLALDYEPKIIMAGNMIGACWNTPHGVVSGYVYKGRISGTCHHGSQATLADACEQMKLNIAQNIADVESDAIPEIIAQNRESVRDYRSWLGFQRAYRDARKQGVPEAECHTFACNHTHQYTPQ